MTYYDGAWSNNNIIGCHISVLIKHRAEKWVYCEAMLCIFVNFIIMELYFQIIQIFYCSAVIFPDDLVNC